MIQFKEKKASRGDSVGLGLYSYPVLMASDILLYGAEKVPVGEDQRQHLELTRDLARRFNDQYCTGGQYKKLCKKAGLPTYPVFREPEAMIVKEGARVMSLTDGTSKMSKSDPSEGSRINVLDSPDIIAQKIKRCKTDAMEGIVGTEDRPEARNLITIYKAVQVRRVEARRDEATATLVRYLITNKPSLRSLPSLAPQPNRDPAEIDDEVHSMNWGTFKPALTDAVVAHLAPIQKRYKEVREEEGYLEDVLKKGAENATEIADQTLTRARAAMGFVPPF